MSGVSPHGRSAPKGEKAKAPGSMFHDPVVRRLTYACGGLVILFLATIVGALFTGVGTRPEAPRTAEERNLVVAAAAVNQGGTTGAQWAPYINALLASGDIRKARLTLDVAQASVQGTDTAAELELAEARVEFAQKRYAQAARAAEKTMKAFEKRQAARLKAGGDTAQRARELGLESDYYAAILVRAYSYDKTGRPKDALKMYDLYIKTTPTAADILIDRGNLKVKMGDKTGAEKDFKAALRFVPDDKEAKAGLKRIGAAK